MSNKSRLKSRLPELCQQAGTTMYGLAKKIGRAPHTLTRIATGERYATADIVVDICDGLGLTDPLLYTLLPKDKG